MNYFFRRDVRRLESGKRVTATVKVVDESVLYALEAHRLLCRQLSSAYETLFEAQPMRIVKRKDTNDYYWLRKYAHKTCFAVKIGVESEIIAFKDTSACGIIFAQTADEVIFFEEIPMSMTLEIPLKNCFVETKEQTELWLSVFYDADMRTLSLQTLNLRGICIKDFPHGYWNVCTVSQSGMPDSGCCGSHQTIRASDTWNIDLGGLEVYDTVSVWTGSKVLKIFKKEDQGFTIEQMLAYWQNFWKVFNC